jgi:uncharacterized membrane protein
LIASPRIVSEPWEQLLDVMIGTEIAVSLIPPAAVVGIGLAFGSANIVIQSFLLLMINVIGLDAVAVPVLYFGGVELKLLQIEKKMREVTANAISGTANVDQVLTDVVLHDYKKADVLVQLQVLEGQSGTVQFLAQAISETIEKETGVSNRVKVAITPIGVYASHPVSSHNQD